MLSFIKYALISGGAILAVQAMGKWSARIKASDAASEARRIRPSRNMNLVMVFAELAIASAGFYGAFFANAGMIALLLAIVFLAMAFLTAMNLAPGWEVRWDDSTLSGPASYFPPYAPRQAQMRFDQIQEVGTDMLGSYYAANGEGVRIRWNGLYTGYPALMGKIVEARPDLFHTGTD